MVSTPNHSRRGALTLLGAGMAVACAGPALSASQIFNASMGATAKMEPAIDPKGMIRPELLQGALAAAKTHKFKSRDRIAVVDFKLHSSKPRFYVVDLKNGAVTPMLSAHGIGSDKKHEGYAKVFSNINGSGTSSLGAYRVLGMGNGPKHGPHLVLDGLDATNNAARERAIIIHSAWYVGPDRVKEWGKLGRSNGCFATSDADRDQLFTLLGPDSLLFAGD